MCTAFMKSAEADFLCAGELFSHLLLGLLKGDKLLRKGENCSQASTSKATKYGGVRKIEYHLG